jgi:adenine deaminase
MAQFSKEMLDAARGLIPADTVFKNAAVFNPFTTDWETGTLAVKNGLVLGIGQYTGKTEFDCDGQYIVPGFIDAHVHIESSLLVPREYARLVVRHGTTSVIADPHEIANVSGTEGIDFMLAGRQGAAIDILYTLPSCVPATPLSRGGAVLESRDLLPYAGREGIVGLGEMMNVPGVLAADPEIIKKLQIFALRDGHAPLLGKKDLNAYILAGLQSDHESTSQAEAEEKLRRGMYIFIREGSTECNIHDLIGLVTPRTVSRCSFASDDSHADILYKKGHIDHSIRKAVECGLEPELAYRMATLSPAERFGLFDRGALTPGRRADLCIIDDPRTCRVRKVFVKGKEVVPDQHEDRNADRPWPFRCVVPDSEAISISGSGKARVIGLIPHQIMTNSLRYPISAREIPDVTRDILKIVVCNRYGTSACGVGLVHGFSLKEGAIATSVSHDSHNIIAAGTRDEHIRKAIEAVVLSKGAMVAVTGESVTTLPLACGGLMSTLPYQKVVERLGILNTVTTSMGCIENPFMYLSFLALPVIPSLRITDQGMFDVLENTPVPIFIP